MAHSVRAIDFETIVGAAELLEQTKIVEGGADEQKLDIELLSSLTPISFAQKKQRCKWLINGVRRPLDSRRMTAKRIWS
jgi:hypothetical protein